MSKTTIPTLIELYHKGWALDQSFCMLKALCLLKQYDILENYDILIDIIFR